MHRSWTKISCWTLNSKNWREWCILASFDLFNICFALPVLTLGTTCPNKYFMFHWSIYSIFMLNKAWKRDSLQMIIFVNACSTFSLVELKTSFETWITRNNLNGINLFHLSYLITLVAYQCSQWAPNVKIKYFLFDWSIYRVLVLNRGWKRDSLQMIIFVYICSACSVVEVKTRFQTWITRNE
jgi:phage anti-repressor protein